MNRAKSFVLPAVFAALLITIAVSMNSADAQQTPSKVAFVAIPAGDYKIDGAHSVIGFSIRHLELALVRGRFKDFSGTINYNDADVTKSSVEFTAKIESIDTGVSRRDEHLRSADFFDAAQHPDLTFKSTRVERKGDKAYILHGDFTMKGVTKQIAIPFTLVGALKDNRGGFRIGVAAETKIDRRDYGITWGRILPNGALDVGHEVMIDLQLEAVKAAPPASQ